MKAAGKIGVVVLVMSMLAQSAFAVPGGALEGVRQSRIKEILASLNAKAFTNKDTNPPAFGKLNYDPNKAMCRPGEECIDAEYEQNKVELDGSTNRVGYINNYGSMLGFKAGMNSESHLKATMGDGGKKGYLEGELTLAYITMGLTEPAVAAGLAQAVNYVGHDVSNRLQSEQVFFSQLQYIPDISQSLGQAYISCIATKQQGGMSWLTAQAACSGDTLLSLPDDSDKTKFVDISGGKSVLSYIDDPNYDSGGPAAAAASSGIGTAAVGVAADGRIILLSDYLFKRDADGGNAGIQKFRDDFKNFIGDIEYSFNESDETNLGSRELTYKKLLPTGEGFDEKLYREAKEVVYEKMIDSFKQACAFNATDPANPYEGDAFLNQYQSTPDDNWATAMSYPAFVPDSTLMRELWELSIDTTNSRCPNYDSSYDWETVVTSPETAPQTARDYMYVAQRIAFGRLYSLYIIAENFIRNLNVGGFDTFARQGAFELLYQTAGTRDLQGVYAENTRVLVDYLQKLSVRVAHRKKFNQTTVGAVRNGALQETQGIGNVSGN